MGHLAIGLGSQQQCHPTRNQMTQSELAACASWGPLTSYRRPVRWQERLIIKLVSGALYMRHVMPYSGSAQPHFLCRMTCGAGCCDQLACMIPAMKAPSSTLREKMDTQSRLREAGTAPMVESRPLVGFIPTHPQKPAGTRPMPYSQPFRVIHTSTEPCMVHPEVCNAATCCSGSCFAGTCSG